MGKLLIDQISLEVYISCVIPKPFMETIFMKKVRFPFRNLLIVGFEKRKWRECYYLFPSIILLYVSLLLSLNVKLLQFIVIERLSIAVWFHG